jgi:hypothetical protein
MPLLSQHRDGSRTAGLVLHRKCSWIGDLSKRAFAGTGPLDLGDYRDPWAAKPRHWIDGGVDVLTSFLQAVQRNVALLNCQILTDPGNDVV